MKTMKSISYGSILLCVLLSFTLAAQRDHSRAFLSGYFGGIFETFDSQYYNNVYVERMDSGLHFSHYLRSDYDFLNTQSATYCDSAGQPLIVWQGCYLLDAKNLSPIENGDFTHTKGANEFPHFFCKKYNVVPGYPLVSFYTVTYSCFFIDRGDPHRIMLVYYRMWNLPYLDTVYMHTATIDLTGGRDGGPIVTERDSLPATFLPITVGSIQAIRHANGRDWYIAFAQNQSANWCSMLYDQTGLHEPVISTIPEWTYRSLTYAQTAVSPDGSKYAYVPSDSNRIFILDFDRCTGKFTYSTEGKFPDDEDFQSTSFYRSGEFAPGGRFFYLNSIWNIYQFDLAAADFADSRVLVAHFDSAAQYNPKFPPGIKGYISSALRGLDGKLYYWSGNTVQWVHRIQYPDRKGPDVGFQQDYYRLPFYPPYLLPTMVDYDMGPLPGDPCRSSVLTRYLPSVWKVYPSPADRYIYIQRELDSPYKSKYTILNAAGSAVLSGQIPTGESLHKIDITVLPPGMYVVKGEGAELSEPIKFLKIR